MYKKFLVKTILEKEYVIYFGHPNENNIYYNNKEVLRLSKWSLMHNLKGLERVMPGHIAYLSKKRVGLKEKKINISEVKVGDRLISYLKFKNKVLEVDDQCNKVSIIRILRWLH